MKMRDRVNSIITTDRKKTIKMKRIAYDTLY